MIIYKFINQDDWVYIGKETYGSRHVTSHALKPGTKFFDALGRVYDKMKARIAYYVFKDAIEKSERDVVLEFEVWARIIKDSEGNDVQVFIKEDKANGLRRDSSFYWDGSWEMLEKDDVARTIRSKTSLGVKTVSYYDNQWRVTSDVMTNKDDDTVAYDQYFWENGRLSKTIFNGVKRVFVYGKTLQDTVKVVPSDEGIYFHHGYNNTVGIIPDEKEPEYVFFAKGPYTTYLASRGKPMLLKYYEIDKNELDNKYLLPVYENPELKYAIKLDSIYPNGGGGETRFQPSINSGCLYKEGCYALEYKPEMVYEAIILYQSHLKYDRNEKKWQRYCRTPEQLITTYRHEMVHIDNARSRLEIYSIKTMEPKESVKLFSTKNECESAVRDRKKAFNELWDAWKIREFYHCNGVGNPISKDCEKGRNDPRSPAPTPFVLGEPCNDDMY